MDCHWLYGLLPRSLLGYVLLCVAMVEATLLAMTLYLHRDAAHRSIDLHPALRHLCRLWIWMTSSILTREWVAVHRKHHAFADRRGDPHSPVNEGLRHILLEGTEFYRRAARDPLTQHEYGQGTPDDWIERHVYSRYRNAGIVGFVLLMLALFGVDGILVVAVQMISMPVLAAGVINGFGHSAGYRNYEVDNAATNIVPWGLVIGGEELHNNHHAFPTSAKFSILPWEFDVGWLCITVLSWVGLAKVKRLATQPQFVAAGQAVDPDAVHAVIRHRMHVLRAYATQVIAPVLAKELAEEKRGRVARATRRLLVRCPALLDSAAQRRLQELLTQHPQLRIVHECQEQLRQLWETINPARDHLSRRFRGWCVRAEASGIQSLAEFAGALRKLSFAVEA